MIYIYTYLYTYIHICAWLKDETDFLSQNLSGLPEWPCDDCLKLAAAFPPTVPATLEIVCSECRKAPAAGGASAGQVAVRIAGRRAAGLAGATADALQTFGKVVLSL